MAGALPLRAAEISLAALGHNLRAVRAHTGARVILVTKANAYGHGADIVAPAAIAAGAEMVAVASISEAAELRRAGFRAPLLCWLHGSRTGFREAIALDIDLGVSSAAQVREAAQLAQTLGRRAQLHLKVDTGLSRNGATPAQWPELFAAAAAAERAGTVAVRSVFSHLANADERADRAQAALYDAALAAARACGLRPPFEHLAASAAALRYPERRPRLQSHVVTPAPQPWLSYNTVRIGVAGYGINPLDDAPSPVALQPVMRVSAEVVDLSYSSAGRGGAVLARLPLGYADGLPRLLTTAPGAPVCVTINGHRAPLVGEIGMDDCTVDVTALARRVQLGDRAVVLGDAARGETPAADWAAKLGTIPYEVLARIGPRVRRVAVPHHTPASA